LQGALALVHVDQRPDPLADGAVQVADGHRARLAQAMPTGARVPHTRGRAVRGPGAHALGPQRLDARAIARVQGSRPAPAPVLRPGLAGEALPRRLRLRELPLRVRG